MCIESNVKRKKSRGLRKMHTDLVFGVHFLIDQKYLGLFTVCTHTRSYFYQYPSTLTQSKRALLFIIVISVHRLHQLHSLYSNVVFFFCLVYYAITRREYFHVNMPNSIKFTHHELIRKLWIYLQSLCNQNGFLP